MVFIHRTFSKNDFAMMERGWMYLGIESESAGVKHHERWIQTWIYHVQVHDVLQRV